MCLVLWGKRKQWFWEQPHSGNATLFLFCHFNRVILGWRRNRAVFRGQKRGEGDYELLGEFHILFPLKVTLRGRTIALKNCRGPFLNSPEVINVITKVTSLQGVSIFSPCKQPLWKSCVWPRIWVMKGILASTFYRILTTTFPLMGSRLIFILLDAAQCWDNTVFTSSQICASWNKAEIPSPRHKSYL